MISTGGAVSNVGLSLHRLGLPVRLVAKIGNDPLGRLIVERIRAMDENLSSGLARTEGEVTSYTVVLNPPGIDRIFLHCPGANDTFTDDDVSDEVIGGSRDLPFRLPAAHEADLVGRRREAGEAPCPRKGAGRNDFAGHESP